MTGSDGTPGVRDAPLDHPDVDAVAAATERAFDRRVESVTVIPEGLNGVYRVRFGDGERAVVKVATLATDATFRAEARVFARTAAHDGVPAPAVLGTIPPGALDAVGYATEYVPGRSIPRVLDLPADAHERLVAESARYLAAVHRLEPDDAFGDLVVGNDGLAVADPRGSWRALYADLCEDRVEQMRGEGVTADADAPFADLAGAFERAFAAFAGDASPSPVLLHSDYRPANLVFAPGNDDRPLVRAVLDPGTTTGDRLFDVALAECALVDTPLSGTERAARLRDVLRSTYRAEAGVDADAAPRYDHYRLYAHSMRLGAFDYFVQFAREDDTERVKARWRERARELLAACEP